jgi:hypothetical protein
MLLMYDRHQGIPNDQASHTRHHSLQHVFVGLMLHGTRCAQLVDHLRLDGLDVAVRSLAAFECLEGPAT